MNAGKTAISGLRLTYMPAILSHGFRVFFLCGSLYAGFSLLLWLPLFHGRIETLSAFAAVDWHIHELLFGYLSAIVTGFLLTAIPNWTRRLPVQGWRLLCLALLWLAGRVAVFVSGSTGWFAAAVIDCAYLLVLVGLAARELLVARANRGQFVVLGPVMILFAGNVVFHLEAHLSGISDFGRRLGLSAAIILIMLIGGRIIPSFTHNWLNRMNPGRLPTPFGRYDAATIGISVLAFAAWVFFPDAFLTGILMVAAGTANMIRLARWAGDRTIRDPLVFVLHAGYAFIPLGFALTGISVFTPVYVPQVASSHAFAAGAIGTMTLAVMVRATLGHTGHELRAGAAGSLIFAAVIAGALLRLVAVFIPSEIALLHLSAALWGGAFITFALSFGGMLLRPRTAGR